ncbi:MAG: macrolide 2-phosphotransferase [Microbacteriaceae bacterium]|nr:macrolide 2-phosphotransferase [Microbacteriaceae bacterium]
MCVAFGESGNRRSTLLGMARSHLTLAALATSAVDDLDVVSTSKFGSPDGNDFDAALLTDRDGRHLIIRVPRNPKAETQQSGDLVALRAISTGVRTRLPFTVSSYVGQTPYKATRAVVYDFVYGNKVRLRDLDAGETGLAASVGAAIAAIHSLPTSFVADAGLPVFASAECLRSAVSLMDRAGATGLVPAPLLGRWEGATEDATMWQFQPTVMNNSLTAESFLAADGAVTGVLGWHGLRVGDPAKDLSWLMGAPVDVADSAFEAYHSVRGSGDRHVRQRAKLYAELEIAKWLLHGTDTRSTEIVDDAVGMLSAIVDSTLGDVVNPIGARPLPTMAVEDVEALLDRTERAV